MDSTIPKQDGGSGRRRAHMAIASGVTLIGAALLVYMVVVEDEPGALPLALIAAGVAWFLLARSRMRPRQP
jgi:hypothetical protein